MSDDRIIDRGVALKRLVRDCQRLLALSATTDAAWLAALRQPMRDAQARLSRALQTLRLLEAEEAGDG